MILKVHTITNIFSTQWNANVLCVIVVRQKNTLKSTAPETMVAEESGKPTG